MDTSHTSLLINENHASLKMRRSLPNNFCAAPFTSLYVSGDGRIYSCQFSGDSIGTLSENPMDLFLSPKMNEYRNSFATGESPPCSEKLNCLKCNRHYDNSLSRFEIGAEAFSELVIDDTVDVERFKSWILPHLGRVKIVTLKFKNSINFELINIFERTNARKRVEINIQLMTPDVFQRIFLTKFEFIQLKINDDLKSIHEIANNTNLHYELIYNEINQDIIPDLYFKIASMTKNIEINILSYLYQSSESNQTFFLKKILELDSRYDSFFYYLYDQFQLFFKKNSHKIEILKMSKMYQMRWVKIKLSRQAICPLPFSQVAIYADGSYRPCCWIGDYDLRDSSTKNDITKVWNGEKAQALRREFISGNIKTCSKKIEELSCIPKDSWKYDQITFTEIQKDPIFKFHWSFNGACNLECPMCSNWKQAVEFDKSDEYFEDLKKNVLPFIGEMELVGGEPFLQKRTFNLIDFMKKNNTLCIWNITSNGQFIFNEKIKDAISGLRIGLFSISIDSLKSDIFSKIRLKGELTKTLTFLNDLLEFNAELPNGFKFDINLNFVIQKDNWREVEDIILFSKSKKIGLYISPVNDAPQFSIYELPKDERGDCLILLENTYAKYKHNNLLVLINSLKKLD